MIPNIELAIIPTNSIQEGDRIREDYGNIKELVMSFQKDGVISPLAVRKSESGDGYTLLAGGRRLRAAKEAKLDSLPVRIYPGKLSELEIKSIELAENIYRKDLTWHERIALDKEIYELQIKIYGEKISTSPNAPGISKRDVAELIGRSPTAFVQDLVMAKAVEAFPELKKCKSKDEARKLLEKMTFNLKTKELVEQLQANQGTKSIDVIRKKLCDSYFVGDFFDHIGQLPSNSIDLIELDPPYSIGLESIKKFRSMQEEHMEGYNEVLPDAYPEFMLKVLMQCYRVMKQDSWLICWFGPTWFDRVKSWIKTSLLDVGEVPAIWLKGKEEDGSGTFQTNTPKWYLGNSYEHFFYARKGDPQIIKQGRANSFLFPGVPHGRKFHPAERPINMIQEVLSTFAQPGSTILVPFLGSGNTILAASNLLMTAFGYELTQEYKDKFIVRVHEAEPGQYRSY